MNRGAVGGGSMSVVSDVLLKVLARNVANVEEKVFNGDLILMSSCG